MAHHRGPRLGRRVRAGRRRGYRRGGGPRQLAGADRVRGCAGPRGRRVHAGDRRHRGAPVSHYTVWVVTASPHGLDAALAPYEEELEVEFVEDDDTYNGEPAYSVDPRTG